ncbi:MAG TPA: hypothetical protein VFO10_16960 [Oligoflexus sp.]|uniref:hypothetical protein n=1 Tax=Oligoflexus sp. TaxID=1971216 RepID=UPI002D7E2214|nr:hypothetical protein [Oligoflexus sp.]HET9238951.1 hypothetical protein [Oligoflexus sp.]
MAKRILLTSGRVPSALELARALARAGCHVVVADSYPTFICQGSRAVAKAYVVPPPRQQPASYELAIIDIIKRERIELVVPASEEVLYLASFAAEIEKHCAFFFADAPLMLQCHHKQNFNDMSHAMGLSVPPSTLLLKGSVAQKLTQDDFVLKRCYSRGGSRVIFAKAGTDPATCDVPMDGSWLIQKKIPGETLCSFSVVQNGRLMKTQLYRPSVTLGHIGVVFQSIRDARIEQWIETFARKTNYHGFLSFDFQRTPAGEIFALECNPRITSGIHLVNPDVLAQAILNPDRPLPQKASRSRAQIVLGVVTALPDILSSPRLAWKTLRECFRAPDVMFAWSDLWPLLYQIKCYLYFFKICRRERFPLSSCTMDGIEWNEERAGQEEASARPRPNLINQA